MKNNKINLVIVANFVDAHDFEFYHGVYHGSDTLHSRAVVHLFTKISHFLDFLDSMPDSYEFRILIHLGMKNPSGGTTGEKLFQEITELPMATKLKPLFVTREPVRSHNGVECIYEPDLNKKEFDFNKIPMSNKQWSSSTQVVPSGYIVGGQENQIVVLTALTESEYEQFRNNMNKKNESDKFFKGTFKTVEGYTNDYSNPFTIIRQQNMGMVDAAAFTSKSIIEHKPDVLIMAGVCGGRKSKVKLFDIIIPTQTVDFTTGKLEDGKLLPYDYSSNPNRDLIEWIKESSRISQIKNNMTWLIPNDSKHQKEREIIAKIKIHFESMACVPWVVKTQGFLEEYANKYNAKIYGLEMESYGVIRTAEVFNSYIKYALIVKSVMDYTDQDKTDVDMVQGINIKDTAAYMSYVCVRALMPIIDEFLKNQKKNK